MNKEIFRRVGSARAFVVAGVLLGFLAAGATVFQMVFLARVVDRVFLKGADLAAVRNLLVFLLLAVVARALLLWVREVVAQRGAVRVKSELREKLFAHVLRLGPAHAGGERTGELTTTATEGIEKLEPYFARYLPQVYLSVVVPLLVAAYVFPMDVTSALLLLATAPVIPILMILVGSYAEDHMKRQWTALTRMGAHFLDAVQGLTTLKAFGREKEEEKRVAAVSEGFRKRTMQVLKYAFLSGLVLEFMTAAAIALIAVTLGVRLVSGSIPFEEAFLVLLLTPEFFRPLRELGTHRHAGMEGKAAAERISELLATEPVSGPLTEPATEPAKAPSAKSPSADVIPDGGLTVELRGVGFTYPGGDRPALSGVDLVLPAGTRTAVVGRSGAGKSTLVNLLARFAEPTEGTICANGVPVSVLTAAGWRERVALVPQRPYLFYGSLLDNIGMARPGATREEIERAADLAGVAEFVGRLPRGYGTQVGERGARLSGGEAQRVAIARAFLKDAPLLVLDEPTSALDPESERLIRVALERLVAGRTTLVVAHRLNTVYTADRILVLQDGRVAEAGTHAHLSENGGPYARFVRAQEGVRA